ncbi:MAG: 30S ribosomal protein S1 [candidate division WOR-3 bacterium]|nr:30S ribosomal protein S1 [candidate division WOR-3 bacterium]
MSEKKDYTFDVQTDYSNEKMEELINESLHTYDLPLLDKRGDGDDEERIIDGRVVRKTEKDLIIDVGLKSEGVVSLSDVADPDEIEVGDTIKVYIENFENNQGFADISLKKARFLQLWPKLEESNEDGSPVEGVIKKRVKGGMIVSLMGVEAFLPGSQIDLQPVSDMDALIGERMKFRVIKLNYKRRNIVVSRRVILESEKEDRKMEYIENLNEGDIVEGVVKNITEFGAFIEIERGIDGLLYITDMSWGRILHPSEIVSIGDTVKVMVTSIDRERGRISLGLKQLTPYPWKGIEEKYPIGSRQEGKIISIEDYGAFVELEKGVEGLIHISEMSWTQHIKHPSEVVEIGDEVEAIVLSIDKKNERISLGIKQLADNPWDRFNEGDIVEGTVKKVAKFGAFVEIATGIEALLHISNVSWDKTDLEAEEEFNEGEEIEAKIINIDPIKKRISLGIKQMGDDPIDRYNVGNMITGKVFETKDKTVIIDIDEPFKAIIPSRLIAMPSENPEADYPKDKEIEVKVIEIDKSKRRLIVTDRTGEVTNEEV